MRDDEEREAAELTEDDLARMLDEGECASVSRYVPDEWVTLLRSIRSVERPGTFDSYYDQGEP